MLKDTLTTLLVSEILRQKLEAHEDSKISKGIDSLQNSLVRSITEGR